MTLRREIEWLRRQLGTGGSTWQTVLDDLREGNALPGWTLRRLDRAPAGWLDKALGIFIEALHQSGRMLVEAPPDYRDVQTLMVSLDGDPQIVWVRFAPFDPDALEDLPATPRRVAALDTVFRGLGWTQARADERPTHYLGKVYIGFDPDII